LTKGLEIRVVPYGPLLYPVTMLAAYTEVGSVDRIGMLSLARSVGKDVDILNCHNLSSNWPAALAKRRLRVPAVWVCNEPPFWFHTAVQKRRWPKSLSRLPLALEGGFLKSVDIPAARAMDRILVLDKKNEARVQRAYGRPSTVVRTGVDSEFFSRSREDLRMELGLHDRFVLLHVGSASVWKGQRLSLRALAQVASQVREAHLILAGYGVRAFCEPMAAELDLSGKVTFVEKFSDDYLARLYRTADVVLFPANQTWGLNVTEAMAAGRAVVVSREAGVSDVVDDGINGCVVAWEDVDELARRILELHSRPAEARRMGSNAAAFARENLSWEGYARSVMKVFEEVA